MIKGNRYQFDVNANPTGTAEDLNNSRITHILHPATVKQLNGWRIRIAAIVDLSQQKNIGGSGDDALHSRITIAAPATGSCCLKVCGANCNLTGKYKVTRTSRCSTRPRRGPRRKQHHGIDTVRRDGHRTA